MVALNKRDRFTQKRKLFCSNLKKGVSSAHKVSTHNKDIETL